MAPALVCLLLCLWSVAGAAEADEAPFAVLLADDTDTRGDWLGAYGFHAYVLCGMRAPHSLCGGEGWPLEYTVSTGDPKDEPRAWKSSCPAENDRSVLLEPNGLKRTPATFDDHGEVRPLGKGPDLCIKMSVPRGPFLVSLYFFEVDWIQYRAHDIKVYAEEGERRLLLQTRADNFFKGRYKRFVVYGPVKLHIVIERGQSPNAQVSGIFLDKLSFPSLLPLKAAEAALAVPDHALADAKVPDWEAAEKSAEEALKQLLSHPHSEAAASNYLRRERLHFLSLKEMEHSSPREYYRSLDKTWGRVAERLSKAAGTVKEGPMALELQLLSYCAARGCCDNASAREETGRIAALLDQPTGGAEDGSMLRAQLLERLLAHFLAQGRRYEATVLFDVYAKFWLESGAPETSRERLVRFANEALRAGVALPAAEALEAWQLQHGDLPAEEQLLIASLFYVAGKNARALEVFQKVEPQMEPGKRHKWVLIAMLTAQLRSARESQAESTLSRLEKQYEGSKEIEEARFRFGVHYFDAQDLARAKKCFGDLRASTDSVIYQGMCNEYLKRIAHLEEVEKQRGGQ
jgi:hypothetical protein